MSPFSMYFVYIVSRKDNSLYSASSAFVLFVVSDNLVQVAAADYILQIRDAPMIGIGRLLCLYRPIVIYYVL